MRSSSIASTLAALNDWTFILGPGWIVGWGNGLILGYLTYRSAQGGMLQALSTVPEFVWELGLGSDESRPHPGSQRQTQQTTRGAP